MNATTVSGYGSPSRLALAERWRVAGEAAFDTPELVIDLGVLRANIARASEAASGAGLNLRPHSKTHKTPEIALMQVAGGAIGIQVAKLGEAEIMSAAGISDILIGYPIVGAVKLHRLARIAAQATVTVSLDSYEVAVGIARAARANGLEIRALLEIDTGMHRVGVQPGQNAVDLAERLASLDGLKFAGLLTHEGHIYTAARSEDDIATMTVAACRAVTESAAAIRERGVDVPVVSVGSSGTLRFAVTCEGITEVRPGTYVFNDRSQIALGAASLDDAAACVIATVVSKSGPDEAVIDAGSKSLTSDPLLIAEPRRSFGEVIGRPDWEVTRVSEEHGVISTPGEGPQIGDRLAILPNHICPAVNLCDRATVIEDSVVVDHWDIAARGRTR